MSSLNMEVYQACNCGDKARAKSLLLSNQSENFSRLPWDGKDTSLHQACRQGWLDIVKLLIEECGFSPDTTNEDSESPLHYACQYGRYDVVKYLIKQGSNPRLKDSSGFEPLDVALLYDHINIACYLGKNCISSAELLAPDRKKRNFIIVRKIIQHDLYPPLPQLKTTGGDSFLNLVCYSSNMTSACLSSYCFKQLLNSVTSSTLAVTDTNDDGTISPLIIKKLCLSQSNVSCVPSAVMSDWLSDTRLDIKELAVSCNWKTADGDTLLQLVCQLKSCVACISSVTMRDWLTCTNTDLLINNIYCKTSDGITLSTILDEIDSKSYEHKDLFLLNTTIDAIITPHWETDDGHSFLKVLFRSESYISCRSSTCLMKWLSKTSLGLNRIVAISNCKTADSDSLLQIVCQSKSCVSRISSKTLRDLLAHTNTDLLIDNLYFETSDQLTLLKIMHQLKCEQAHCLLPSPPTQVIITPHWEADDGHSSLKILFQSELYISCGSSTYLTNWLSKTPLDLNRIAAVSMKTIDDVYLDEILFNSEACISRTPSTEISKWLTDTTFNLEKLLVPSWKTADGDTLLQVICKSESFVSRIPSKILIKWLSETTVDISTLINPCWTTADGDTLLELLCKSETCVSHIPSVVMLKWLNDTRLYLKKLIVPDWKTADGDALLQLVCKSESCVSRTPSSVIMEWLRNPILDLVSLPVPNLKTADGHALLLLVCCSEICLSQISSRVILSWLHESSTRLNGSISSSFETADGDSMLKLLYSSECTFSCGSSNLMLGWINEGNESTFSTLKTANPNWKTAD